MNANRTLQKGPRQVYDHMKDGEVGRCVAMRRVHWLTPTIIAIATIEYRGAFKSVSPYLVTAAAGEELLKVSGASRPLSLELQDKPKPRILSPPY
ncbi:unnamed protein product [Strongylus vulgaris]|uniref:Uncharacterized protein n=1 Tax=Strongylus vulgaris TaxID=40348 RepID=A0A3P7KDH6_STRVU|nr:unnamed protein product [Strongylus vulgaris]